MNAPRFTVEDLQLFVKQGLIAQSAIEQMPEYKRAVRAAQRAMTREAGGRKRLARPEQDIQHALCQWWELKYRDSWEYTFHTPNGLAAKNRKLAAIFKGLGLKSGVPDLLCLQRRGLYTGFALELKADDGNLTKNQHDWADRLILQGYYVGCAHQLEAAMYMVDLYHTHAPAIP